MAVAGRRAAAKPAIKAIIALLGCALIMQAATEHALGREVASPPARMLWAWERPEDLRFIDAKTTGVAYLVATIKLRGGAVICINRHQPLRVPPGTYMMPVVRIESDGTLDSSRTTEIEKIAAIIPRFLTPRVRGFQFDFDARKSERGWYKNFLMKMRETLPADLYLSMTSIASWCLGDDWINGNKLPVDEVVPMFFELGADTRQIGVLLDNGNTFGHTFQSIGISDKDMAINKRLGKFVTGILKPTPRLYMFSRKPWNQQKVQMLVQEVNNWK